MNRFGLAATRHELTSPGPRPVHGDPPYRTRTCTAVRARRCCHCPALPCTWTWALPPPDFFDTQAQRSTARRHCGTAKQHARDRPSELRSALWHRVRRSGLISPASPLTKRIIDDMHAYGRCHARPQQANPDALRPRPPADRVHRLRRIHCLPSRPAHYQHRLPVASNVAAPQYPIASDLAQHK